MAPPNTPVLGAFMEIFNHSDHDIKLLFANASGYKRVELHRTVAKNGMMKMIRQNSMPIDAYNKLVLKPGGWHIMLIEPELVPSKGDIVKIKLVFDNGLSKTIYAKVKKAKMMMKHKN